MQKTTRSHRAMKVASEIKKVLSGLLLLDDDLRCVSITEVDVSPNLRFSKVYFVCGEANVDDIMMLFDIRLKHLQKDLAEAINLKYATTLQFIYDKAFDHADKITKILDEIAHEKKPTENQ